MWFVAFISFLLQKSTFYWEICRSMLKETCNFKTGEIVQCLKNTYRSCRVQFPAQSSINLTLGLLMPSSELYRYHHSYAHNHTQTYMCWQRRFIHSQEPRPKIITQTLYYLKHWLSQWLKRIASYLLYLKLTHLQYFIFDHKAS